MERDAVLSQWLDVVWKHKWLVTAFCVLVMTATAIVTKRQTRTYRATTQVVIQLEAPQYLPQAGGEVVRLGSGNTWNTTEFFETQYRIIRSRRVAEEVVHRELKVDPDYAAKLGKPYLRLDNDLSFLGIDEIESPEDRARAFEKADPAGILLSRIEVEPIAESHVVLIHVRDSQPRRARVIADAVAEAYMRINLEGRDKAVGRAVEWLKDKVSELELQLERDEQALLVYKRDNNILNASLSDKQNMLGLDLQDAQRQLRESRLETGKLRSQLKQVQRLSPLEAETSVEAVLENGLIQQLKRQYVELQNERTALLKKYLEKHPDVETADQQIKRVKQAIEREVAGVRQAIERQFQMALNGERELAAEVETLKASAKSLHAMEREYKRLAGAVETTKTLHEAMLMRLKEAELQAETRENNIEILDRALVPTSPVSPRLSLNLLVAAVLSLLTGIGLAFLVEQLDNSVKSQEQLEKDYGLTFLGIIPSIRSVRARHEKPVVNTDRYIFENPNSTAAEAVRTIRTNLLFMSPEREIRSMVVTSSGPREGKTSTCVNLGATMAMAGSRIVLVDSDLRRPRLHKIFDMTNDRGLTNLIMNPDVPVESFVKPSGLDGLDIMCSGPLPPNPSELLQTKGFRRALDRLLATYDRVIFDSPPVVAVTDAQILGMQVDGAVLVVRAGETTRQMLQTGVRLLKDVKVHVFGALLNNLDLSSRGYNRYYYAYYQRHKGYAAETAPVEEPEDRA